MINIEKIKQEKPIADLLDFAIINLNKPSGLTSFQTALEIKKILCAKKSGHFGTLDSNVTGVLPISLNQACKLSSLFMKKDKEYIGTMRLHSNTTRLELEETIKKFIGKINQMPPVRSAVKRQLRERTINKFDILKFNDETRIVEFVCDVEAGTYIRKLIHDIGQEIGGAQMISLRRIRAGFFNETDSHNIEEIKNAFEEYKNGNEKKLREILIPGEIISQFIGVIQVKEKFKLKFENGSPLFKDMLKNERDFDRLIQLQNEDYVALFIEDKFIEVAKISKKENRIAMPYFVFS